MLRTLLRICCGAGIVGVILFLASYFFYQHTAFLNNHLQRYLDRNINQNWGVRKATLRGVDSFNNLLPMIKPVQIDYDLAGPGTLKEDYPLPSHIDNLVIVKNSEQLSRALKSAVPGDGILLLPGSYNLSGARIELGNKVPKKWERNTFVFAESFGDVQIILDTTEGFYVDKPNWTFQNLIINGVCPGPNYCEHAFHIVGNASNFVLANSIVKNFNSHIKSNGFVSKKNNERLFPHNVKIINNAFFNDYLRKTLSPATPLDIVGGDNWLIEGNFVSDFTKAMYTHRLNWTYGIFLKGGGKNGVIRNNLVACEWRLSHYSKLDARVGISIGGGSTENQFCPKNDCSIEHHSGQIIENTIVNCTNDSAIYINKGADIQIRKNRIVNSLGIEARFPQTSLSLVDNDYEGITLLRDGARLVD